MDFGIDHIKTESYSKNKQARKILDSMQLFILQAVKSPCVRKFYVLT